MGNFIHVSRLWSSPIFAHTLRVMIKSMADHVSIVMPNYNHAQQLYTSLSAIFAQTKPADEIIIIDDASTDQSKAVIGEFSGGSPEIHLISNERNMGVAYSVRRGVEQAKSRYVILAGADDQIMPDMVKSLSCVMETFPNAKMAVSSYAEWYPESDDIIVHDQYLELLQRYFGSTDIMFLSPDQVRKILAKGSMLLQATTAIFDRHTLLDVGVFDPALEWLGDWFTMHMLALRHGTVVVPKTLAAFRRDDRSYSAQGLKNRTERTKILDYLFAKIRQPKYRDIYEGLRLCPSAVSPLVCLFLPYALRNFYNSSLCRAILSWYLTQVMKGQRPAFLARMTQLTMPVRIKRSELF